MRILKYFECDIHIKKKYPSLVLPFTQSHYAINELKIVLHSLQCIRKSFFSSLYSLQISFVVLLHFETVTLDQFTFLSGARCKMIGNIGARVNQRYYRFDAANRQFRHSPTTMALTKTQSLEHSHLSSSSSLSFFSFEFDRSILSIRTERERSFLLFYLSFAVRFSFSLEPFE